METSPARLDRAHNLAEVGRYGDALAEISVHLGQEPEDAEALCLAAFCHLRMRQPQRAEEAAAAALRADPDSEWPFRLRSIALSELGRIDEALAMAGNAVRRAPYAWETYVRLTEALVEAGQVQAAQAAAARAVELGPNESDAYLAVAFAADAGGRRREERAALHKALELDPESSIARQNLAAMDVNRGRLGRGTRGLVDALRLDPQHGRVQQNLDAVLVRTMARIGTVTLLTGVAVAILLAKEQEETVPAFWPRALVGTALVGVMAVITWLTVRHVPPAARPHLGGALRRARGWNLFVVVILALAVPVVLWLSFMPADRTGAAMELLGGLVRVVQACFVATLLMALLRRMNRS